MLEKDFMQEVLKRFDKIDAKLDEHSKEFINIHAQLDEHSKEFINIHAQLDEHSKFIHRNTELIINNSKKIDKILKEIEGFTEIVSEHHKTLIDYRKDFNKNKKSVKEKIMNLNSRISSLENLNKTNLA